MCGQVYLSACTHHGNREYVWAGLSDVGAEIADTMITTSKQEPVVTLTPHVRPLAGSDMPAFLDLCSRHQTRFITPRLNVETYGFDGPVLHAWGAFGSEGSSTRGIMLGLLFRLNNTMIAVDADGACSASFCKVIDSELGIAGIRGTAELVSGLRLGIRRYRAAEWEDSYLMKLTRPPACTHERIAIARRASIRDLDMLAQLYQDAGTMYRSRPNVASKLAESRVFVVEEPALGRRAARIAACALLSPEGTDAGLIGGVYTMPAARNKGYAAACVSALAADIQRDGKLPVLFYENPIAGALYRKLGFEECGRWGVLYLGCTQDRS